MTVSKAHTYAAITTWTGNLGEGTRTYRGYSRDHDIACGAKPPLLCSSDPAFRGTPSRHNPEELLVASLSGCHLLWFLHLCADAGITVTAYRDEASGTMVETEDGGGRFTEVVLRPHVVVEPGADPVHVDALHHRAHALCFIAGSVNFTVRCEPRTTVAAGSAGPA
jgi:organic hydroperoxide reductase OsmC/OhrA